MPRSPDGPPQTMATRMRLTLLLPAVDAMLLLLLLPLPLPPLPPLLLPLLLLPLLLAAVLLLAMVLPGGEVVLPVSSAGVGENEREQFKLPS